MVAIRVANEVGGQNVIDVARRLGVRSPLSNYHSLALGAQEITLMEMTQAYAVMANQGRAVEAHGVTRIRRASNGEVVWSFRPASRDILIEDRPRRYMNYMMARVVNSGTGTTARISGREIGGKTGTGNDYRDAWFVGFTPGFAAGVWVGNDNFAETARVTGGSLPAEIWARYANVALRNVPAQSLDMPGADDYGLGTEPGRSRRRADRRRHRRDRRKPARRRRPLARFRPRGLTSASVLQ
jgi:penicillin-binding protein 1A